MGTGENFGVTEALKNMCLSKNKDIRFIDILYQDKRITNAFYSAYHRKKRPVLKKIVNRLSRIFFKKNIFIIKKKIYCYSCRNFPLLPSISIMSPTSLKR